MRKYAKHTITIGNGMKCAGTLGFVESELEGSNRAVRGSCDENEDSG